MNNVNQSSVAVIGLGRMGAAMARRLLRQDVPVTVWDRRADRAAELAAEGAAGADTPAAAAAGQDLVLVSVADWSATQDVLFGTGGVLAGGPIAGVLVSTTTLAPENVITLADHTPAVLDAGLQGNHQHAEAGELRVYVGGPEPVLARVRPVLDRLAQQVRHVGDLGAGMRLKLVMNLLMGVEMQVMAEAVALGTGLGLDRAVVLEAITGGGFASPVMNFKARRMASGDYTAPDFRLRLMTKDLHLAVTAGEGAGVSLPVVRAARDTHRAAVAAGDGDQDCAAIIRTVTAAGVPAAAARVTAVAAGGASS